MRVLGCIVAAAMVAAPVALPAQQTSPAAQPTRDQLAKKADDVMAELLAHARTCPVGFRAELDPRLTLRAVKGGTQVADSTLVRLVFDRADTRKAVVAASMTAHGVAPHSELMLVGQSADNDRTQAFHLARQSGSADLVQAEVEVTGVPFVRWVELNQIKFADGSVWHAAAGATCKSVLSKFHPV